MKMLKRSLGLANAKDIAVGWLSWPVRAILTLAGSPVYYLLKSTGERAKKDLF
jgi:hypothetical protein